MSDRNMAPAAALIAAEEGRIAELELELERHRVVVAMLRQHYGIKKPSQQMLPSSTPDGSSPRRKRVGSLVPTLEMLLAVRPMTLRELREALPAERPERIMWSVRNGIGANRLIRNPVTRAYEIPPPAADVPAANSEEPAL